MNTKVVNNRLDINKSIKESIILIDEGEDEDEDDGLSKKNWATSKIKDSVLKNRKKHKALSKLMKLSPRKLTIKRPS